MKKVCRVALTVLTDIVLTGIALCVFALFHHVLPRAYVVEEQTATGEIHSIEAAATTDGEAEQTNEIAQTEPSEETDESVSTTENQIEVISTDTYYSSEQITVTLTNVESGGIVYHVEDIYIQNVENLRTAFAEDTYGKGIREETLEMAVNNNAVAAINGDYYGNGDNGVVIRNGVLYRSEPDADVFVMYYDGTMKAFSEREFDADTEMANGAYQAWCFGPILVENGEALSGFSGNISGDNPRTAIGYYEPGHYCFVCVDGRSDESDGVSLNELANLMEELGCESAYNLDGGKSSVMTFGSEVVNVAVDGGRRISNIIYIAEIEE